MRDFIQFAKDEAPELEIPDWVTCPLTIVGWGLIESKDFDKMVERLCQKNISCSKN